MLTNKITTLLATLSLVLSSSVLANSAEIGKQKSATCMACHGIDGISPNDMWPNLKGQKKGYLITAIKAYKNGERQNVMMAPMVAKLTDEDIEAIAEYYSALE